MATTYTLISSVTVGSGGAANIEFTSIPATYTDLVILTSLRTDRASAVRDVAKIQFNGNTGTNYSERELYAEPNNVPASASATGQTSARCGYPAASTATANSFSNDLIYIPNYGGSNNKSFSVDSVMETNATTNGMVMIAGLWSQTAAITSIKIFPLVGPNFVQYSTAYLYGISNA
jgi:hypothetical protein